MVKLLGGVRVWRVHAHAVRKTMCKCWGDVSRWHLTSPGHKNSTLTVARRGEHITSASKSAS
jgi:hypothetical protein